MLSPAKGLLRGLRAASLGVVGFGLALVAHVAATALMAALLAYGERVLWLLAGWVRPPQWLRVALPVLQPVPVASSRSSRAAAVGALVAAVVIGTATSAAAHVGVLPDSTVSGHEAQLTFRVPDESETASTVKLVVTLPQDRPFTDVSTQPMPGWTATVTDAPLPKPVKVGGATITKAPHIVTWTAQPGNKIAPGEYQNFSFATDALPAAGEMVLPVAQYYSDGTVVHWTEPTVPGKAEPEHPAPVFTVTAATATDASATPAANTQASGKTAPAATTTDSTARVLGGVGLLVALVAAGLVLLRRRPKADVK